MSRVLDRLCDLLTVTIVGKQRLDLLAHFCVTSARRVEERRPLLRTQIERFQEETLNTLPVFHHCIFEFTTEQFRWRVWARVNFDSAPVGATPGRRGVRAAPN